MSLKANLDPSTISSFGDEWERFDQKGLVLSEAQKIFDDYFSIFPWEKLTQGSQGFDMGCGSGRWARFVAPRVGILHCIDPSCALEVARRNLNVYPNIRFHKASVSSNNLLPNSQDFGYSLGVLHHLPNTAEAIRSCTLLLKPGAPLLLYLYYAFDNRPRWYQCLWQLSNYARLFICHLPPFLKQLSTDLIAFLVYLPLSRLACLAELFGLYVDNLPLSYYRRSSLYTMRTDARDRLGTPLEQRFTKAQIHQMCTAAGLVDISFSSRAPFWCVVGFKAHL
jgi:SAM-dependent methyltransferase